MAVIGGGSTGWFWDNIDRRVDTQIDGGVVWTRNNWKLTRHRRSNATLTNSLRETATSLTGNNGGVDETIDAPSVNALSFVMSIPEQIAVGASGISGVEGTYTENGTYGGAKRFDEPGNFFIWFYSAGGKWVLNRNVGTYSTVYYEATGISTDNPWDLTWVLGGSGSNPVPTVAESANAGWASDADRLIESGYYHNGYPVYIPYNKINTQYPQKLNAVWYSETGTTNGKWCIAPMDPTEISGDTFQDEAAIGNYPDAYAIADTATTVLDGLDFTGYGDWVFIAGAASLGSTTMFFICTADVPSYPNQFTDYYLQTQEWIYQDNWVRTV